MRVAIFGSGGVGGYFGGRLAEAGQDVTFIARGAHLQAMKKSGLRVDSIAGNFRLDQVAATDRPHDVGVVDYVICAVKAWQVPATAKAMRPMIGPNTLVIPLQNGVEAPAHLIEVLGQDAVLGGLCAIIAFRTGPGHITHNGANPLIRFGQLDGRADIRVNTLYEIFNRCHGVSPRASADSWTGSGMPCRPVVVLRTMGSKL